jgi:hypothetical protein
VVATKARERGLNCEENENKVRTLNANYHFGTHEPDGPDKE